MPSINHAIHIFHTKPGQISESLNKWKLRRYWQWPPLCQHRLIRQLQMFLPRERIVHYGSALGYRNRSSVKVLNSPPIQWLDECVNSLCNVTAISTFDNSTGYWYIGKLLKASLLHCSSRMKAISRFVKMLFGLWNGPGTIQCGIHETFSTMMKELLLGFPLQYRQFLVQAQTAHFGRLSLTQSVKTGEKVLNLKKWLCLCTIPTTSGTLLA